MLKSSSPRPHAKTGKLIKQDARQDIFQGEKAFEIWDKAASAAEEGG